MALLNVDDVADRLGVSRSRAYQVMAEIPCVREPGCAGRGKGTIRVEEAALTAHAVLVSACSIAASCGVSWRFVDARAKIGLVPSVIRGSQRRYDPSVAVPAVLAAKSMPRRARAKVEDRVCVVCRARKPRASFRPNGTGLWPACNDCTPAYGKERYRRERPRAAAKQRNLADSLDDRYVAALIHNTTGLSQKAIPSALLKAKRAQLMLERRLGGRGTTRRTR
jgi:hypothetical protein